MLDSQDVIIFPAFLYMAEEPTKNKEQQNAPIPAPAHEKSSSFNRILGIAAYPISAVAGLVQGRLHIRQKAYETFKRIGTWENEIKETREKVIKEMSLIDSGVKNDIKKEIIEDRNDFTKAVGKHFKKMGYKHFWDMYGPLAPHEKAQVWEKGMTVFGVTLGVLLTVANSKSLISLINEKDTENNDKSAAR